jgi:hypothetical protein
LATKLALPSFALALSTSAPSRLISLSRRDDLLLQVDQALEGDRQRHRADRHRRREGRRLALAQAAHFARLGEEGEGRGELAQARVVLRAASSSRTRMLDAGEMLFSPRTRRIAETTCLSHSVSAAAASSTTMLPATGHSAWKPRRRRRPPSARR